MDSSSGEDDSKNSTIEKYILKARRKRNELIRSASSKKKKLVSTKKAAPEEDYELDSQLLIPFGEMYHCPKRGRGIHIRNGKLRNVFLRSDTSYSRMLEKCSAELYSEDERQHNTFYIADSRGVAIWNSDKMEVDTGKGISKKCEWTLSNYIKLSRIKYPSKAKFFCVKQKKDDDETGFQDSDEDVIVKQKNNGEEAGLEDSVMDVAPPVNDDPLNVIETEEDNTHKLPIEEPPFEPLFILRKKSKFAEKYVFATGNQVQILSMSTEELGEKECYEQAEKHTILPMNPLHNDDTFFAGIRRERDGDIDIIRETDSRSGQILYKSPELGNTFNVWASGYAVEGIGVLAYVALNGSHCLSKYQWYQDESIIQDEVFPVIYVTQCGIYKCKLSFFDIHVHELEFVLSEEGDNRTWKVTVMFNTSSTNLGMQLSTKRLQQVLEITAAADHTAGLELLNVIGKGSFGTVYSACWRGTIIAAKVLPFTSSEAQSLVREIKMLQNVHHPNLSSCLGVHNLEQGLAILSPIVRGRNLHDHLFSNDKLKLTFDDKMYILIQISQAVVYLHLSVPPMAHLDIKPDNILVDPLSMQATLTDFGLSRCITSSSIVGTRTMMAGSPGYQSPEQLRAESLGPHCDIYAYGCVAIVIFQEKLLWPNLNQYQILCKVTVSQEYPDMSLLPSAIKTLCARCLLPMKQRLTSNQVLDQLLAIAIKK